jgi:spore coat protein U-like protein
MWTNIDTVHLLRAMSAACLLSAAYEASAASCTISATGPAFGTYDLFASAPLDAAGTLEFRCTEPSAVRIHISPGGAGTYWPRAMRSGTATLQYNLFTNAGRTQVWGDGTGGTSDRTVGASRGQPVAVFGRIPPLQDVTSGTYSDTLVATFNF